MLYVIAGLLLVMVRYVPVGLVILGPILVVILRFHITFSPKELPMAVVCMALEVFLRRAYWPAFRGIFTA